MTKAVERLDPVGIRRLLWFSLAALGLVVLACTVYGALLPAILISCFLTYLLLPFVNFLESQRVPRTLAIALLVGGTVVVLVVGAVRIVPLVYQQLVALLHLIPGVVATVSNQWLPAFERTIGELGFFNQEEVHKLLTADNVTARVATELQGNVKAVWKTGTSLFGDLLYIVLVPLLTFFLLKDFRHIARGMASLVPRDLLIPTRRVCQRLDVTLKSVLKGQAIVAAVLAVLYMVGLTAVGLPSAIVIGLVAGFCRLIPYCDVIVGGILSALVMVSYGSGAGQFFSVVAVFLVVQMLDGAFVTPGIIGDRIGLHPLVVVLSVLAFGDWLGFWGVLLAVPIAAVVKVLLESLLPYYKASRAYQRGEWRS